MSDQLVPDGVLDHINQSQGMHFRLRRKFEVGREGAWEVVSSEYRGVLKCSFEPQDHLALPVLVEHLRAHDYPTPSILLAGRLGSIGYHIVEFVEATRLPGWGRKLEGEALDLVIELVHRARTLAPPVGRDWSEALVDTVFEDRLDLERRVSDEGIRLLSNLAAAVDGLQGTPVPVADFVHGDFGPHNIVISSSGPMVLDLAGSGFGTHAIDLADLVPGIAAQDRRRVEAVLAHTERIEVASIAMAYQALHWLWRDLLHGVEPAWTLENLATSTARIRAWRDA